MLTVKILVEAVVVTLSILQKQWCRLELACAMAAVKELGVSQRVFDTDAHGRVPAVRDRDEMIVDGGTEILHKIGQWITKILIFPTTKTVPSHYDTASKEIFVAIQFRDGAALFTRDEAFQYGVPLRVKFAMNGFPIDRIQPVNGFPNNRHSDTSQYESTSDAALLHSGSCGRICRYAEEGANRMGKLQRKVF